MNKALAVIALLFLTFSLSGCATALFMKGKPTDYQLITWEETVPLKSATPYLNARRFTTLHDRYIDAPNDIAFIGTLLMEFTPLGLSAPLFGYPDITDQDILGAIAVKLSQPVENVRVEGGKKSGDWITFDFATNGAVSGTHNIRLYLSNGDREVIPSHVDFNITYDKKTCSCEADPDIVSDNGLIRIKTEDISQQFHK